MSSLHSNMIICSSLAQHSSYLLLSVFLSEFPGNPVACLLTLSLVVRLPSNISSRVPSRTSRRILSIDMDSQSEDRWIKKKKELEPGKSCSPIFSQGPKNDSKEKIIFNLIIILTIFLYLSGLKVRITLIEVFFFTVLGFPS